MPEKESFTAEITDHETDNHLLLRGNIIIMMAGSLKLSGDDHIVAINPIFSEKRQSARRGIIHRRTRKRSERQIVLWLRSVKEYLRLYAENTPEYQIFQTADESGYPADDPFTAKNFAYARSHNHSRATRIIVVILVGWFFFLS